MRSKYLKILKSNFIKLSLLLLPILLNGQTGNIFGFVTDSSDGEALIGANVFLRETGQGMATDKNGYYVLQNISFGTYTLQISYVGYKTLKQELIIENSESMKMDFALSVEVVEAEAVDVTAESIQRKFNIQPGKINLSPRMLKAQPALAEPDLFRTIQTLPGVLTTSEFSTGLVIRGGNTDQNLILLDGITVYNPSHFGGVFSNFIVDGVKEAELIKGGYNAEYGGRLSAVLNVLSREGNRNKFEGKTSISILSAQTTLEGPSYKGAWLVSARRTYFDQIFKNNPDIPPYYFYDIQGHVFSDLSPKDRISLSFYGGLDDFLFNDLSLSAEWGNETVSLSYRRVFSDRMIGNFLAANSKFFTRFGLGGDDGLNSDNLIDDNTLSSDFTFFYTENSQIKFGSQLKNLGFTYLNTFGDSTRFKIEEFPVEGAVYTKYKWSPTERLILEPGIRYNYYSVYPKKPFIDLRLGSKYLMTDNQYINFTVGNYHQFIETAQDDFNPGFLDNWLAVDESVDPASAVQYVLGYEAYIKNQYKIQVEGYYKDIKNMLTFEDTRSSTDAEISDQTLRDSFTPSDGYAYGVEVFTQKNSGSLSGWLAYTFSISRKKMNNQEYFSNWDRTHVLNFVGNYMINPKWEVNWKWTWQSGQAYTPILGYYLQKFPSDPSTGYRTIPGVRNGGRYPVYHRLDLGAVRHYTFKNAKMDLFFQVINGYNQKNIFRYVYRLGNTFNGIDDDGDWDVTKHDVGNENGIGAGNGEPDYGEPNVDEDDEGRIQEEKLSLFPIIPSIGITIKF